MRENTGGLFQRLRSAGRAALTLYHPSLRHSTLQTAEEEEEGHSLSLSLSLVLSPFLCLFSPPDPRDCRASITALEARPEKRESRDGEEERWKYDGMDGNQCALRRRRGE